MPALLDFRSMLRRHREERSGDVHDLARRLVTGETVDPESVIRATTAAGMSDEDFLELVDMVRTREDLKRQAATYPAIEAELVAVRAAIAKHNETLKEAERRYREAVTPLAAQERDAENRLANANHARGSLIAASNLPRPLAEAIESARAAVTKAGEAVRDKRQEYERQERRSVAAREKLDAEHGGADKAIAEHDAGDTRRKHSGEWTELVEAARYGGHRAAVARQELEQLLAAHAAAEKSLRQAEKEARDF